MSSFDSTKRSLIRLPKNRYKVKEISYDDNGDSLVINIDYDDLLDAEEGEEEKMRFAQLFGRALARTRINEELSSSWTFLSAEDFEKTGSQYSDRNIFYKISQKLNDLVPTRMFSFVFWQEESGVFCLAASEKESGEKLALLAEKTGSDLNNGYFVAGPFENFSGAEIKIKQVLKETIL
jgi:hypothetical protein